MFNFKFTILCLGLYSVVGCMKSDDVIRSNQPIVVAPPSTEKSKKYASCDFSYFEGQKAVLSLPDKKVTQTHFLKEYSAGYLDSVLNTSAAETEKMIRLTEADVYVVSGQKIENLGCVFGSSIPRAPKYFADEFIKTNKSGRVAGQYLSKSRVQKENEDDQLKAAMMMTETGNRYVMVHEYMHHLFSVESQIDEVELFETAKKNTEIIINESKLFEAEKNSENLTKLVASSIIFTETNLEILKQYYLEEMAIETILYEKYQSKQLLYVPVSYAVESYEYILSSNEKADSQIKSLLSLNQLLTAELNKMINIEESKKLSLAADLLALSSKINKLIDEKSVLKRKAEIRKILDEKSTIKVKGFVAPESQLHRECAHSKKVDQLTFNIIQK